MNFDYERLSQWGPQIDHILDMVPYPIEKDELILRAQQAGMNPQVIVAMQQILPDKTFDSSQDVKKFFSSQHGQARM